MLVSMALETNSIHYYFHLQSHEGAVGQKTERRRLEDVSSFCLRSRAGAVGRKDVMAAFPKAFPPYYVVVRYLTKSYPEAAAVGVFHQQHPILLNY
jgi:hypothetical protein